MLFPTIGVTGGAVGITTPLIVHSVSKNLQKTKPVFDLADRNNDSRSQTEANLVNNQVILASPAHTQSHNDVKGDLLKVIKIEKESPYLLEALNILKAVRKNEDINKPKRLSGKQKEELENLYERFTTSDSDGWSNSYDVRANLQRINWTGEGLKLLGDLNQDKNWGWEDWESNPFKSFYVHNGEDSWRNKMKLYDFNTENKDRNFQIESEIEFDIADWLLKEVEKRIRQSGTQ